MCEREGPLCVSERGRGAAPTQPELRRRHRQHRAGGYAGVDNTVYYALRHLLCSTRAHHPGAQTQPSPRPGPSRPQRPLAAQASPTPNALWLCAPAAVHPPRSRGPWRGHLSRCGPRRGGASSTAAATAVPSAMRSAVRRSARGAALGGLVPTWRPLVPRPSALSAAVPCVAALCWAAAVGGAVGGTAGGAAVGGGTVGGGAVGGAVGGAFGGAIGGRLAVGRRRR